MATQTATARTFSTRIDIPESSRRQLIDLLNARLADTSRTIDKHLWFVEAHQQG